MQSERLTNFKVFVEEGDVFRQLGTAFVELPILEPVEAPPIQTTVTTHISGTVDCIFFDRRRFLKFIGAGYYAKTKGKQPRTVFVIKRGYHVEI